MNPALETSQYPEQVFAHHAILIYYETTQTHP